jgi:hypothetical protein
MTQRGWPIPYASMRYVVSTMPALYYQSIYSSTTVTNLRLAQVPVSTTLLLASTGLDYQQYPLAGANNGFNYHRQQPLGDASTGPGYHQQPLASASTGPGYYQQPAFAYYQQSRPQI